MTRTNAGWMPRAKSDQLFDQLPEDIRQRFYAEATDQHAGRDWFYREIPDNLKSDPEGIDILLNGGEVTVDGVTHTIPAHEFSRVQSGANGGSYTPDNVILESEKLNGSRLGDNMSPDEYAEAEQSLTDNIDLILSRDTAAVASEAVDVGASIAETSTAVDAGSADIIAETAGVAEATDGILETVLEGVLPVTVGARCVHGAWKNTEYLPTGKRAAVAAAGGACGFVATAVVVANPVGAACVAAYGTWKLISLGTKLYNRYGSNVTRDDDLALPAGR